MTVGQERREELVGGARDAATAAQKVHEASNATGLAMEVASSGKGIGKGLLLSVRKL